MVDARALEEAQAALARRDWASAGRAYRLAGPIGELPATEQLRRNLAVNFAELAECRPEVLARMMAAPADGRFRIAATPSTRPTICFNDKPLSIAADPLAGLQATMRQLDDARRTGKPLGIMGTGDGYLLVALARHPLPLALGRQQAVHFWEPNVANLLAALTIHDYSGNDGAIRQARFHWYAGPDCVQQFRDAYLGDPGINFPEIQITAEPDGAAIGAAIGPVLGEVLKMDAELAERVKKQGERVTLAGLLDVTGPRPSRAPRALLLTTRFSTVLQYSTADLAAGLRELGWEAEVAMEAAPHHVLTMPGLRRAILRTDPDVVFQLDHLRAEHGTLIPAGVPFVCWAQDHMPNLCNSAAGRAQGELDFFMTSLPDWFVREYAYPPEGMLAAPKFTRLPELPAEWVSDGLDLTYVSNSSALPAEGAAGYVARFGSALQPVAQRAAARLIAAYEAGESFAGTLDVQPFVDAAAAEEGFDPAVLPHELTVDLYEKVNNLCYRQQALGWVADVADEMGLSLGIFGSGWEKHPRFARYARGHVEYGAALEQLTRASRINLQIVPYFCLHQRLLDGVAAGGFFLVRAHPADLALPALCAFVEAHVPGDVRTYAEARDRLSPDLLAELDRHAAANAHIADLLDVVQQARNARAMGLFPDNTPMPARIAEVSFSNACEFRERVRRFLGDERLRREVALAQRDGTAGILSYTAGMRRVLATVRARLLDLERGRRVAA